MHLMLIETSPLSPLSLLRLSILSSWPGYVLPVGPWDKGFLFKSPGAPSTTQAMIASGLATFPGNTPFPFQSPYNDSPYHMFLRNILNEVNKLKFPPT